MFEFAFIGAFLLWPLPLLVYFVLPKVKKTQKKALTLPYLSLLGLHIDEHKQSGRIKKIALWMMWTGYIVALSGPQWVGQAQALPRTGRNLMLALDLSGSMQIKDMSVQGHPVSRLTVVKKTAIDFVKHRQGDHIGLILFGTNAYLQTPLTFDRKTVEHMINDASVGLAGQTTSIGDAIGLAIKKLKKLPAQSRVLVLLTDGANNSGVLTPMQAAEIAKDNHIKIYTIGLGAARAMVQGYWGWQAVNPSSDLDEKTLKDIAQQTGGLFFRAKDSQQLQAVYQKIDKLEPVKLKANPYRPITQYYYWPLLVSLLFYFLLVLKSWKFRPVTRMEQGQHG